MAVRAPPSACPLWIRPGHSCGYTLYSLVLIARARVQRSCVGRDVYAAMVGTTLLPTYSTDAVGLENPKRSVSPDRVT